MHCLICYKHLQPDTTWSTLFTSAEKQICADCESQFERLIEVSNHHCQICMRPLKESLNLCGDCFAWRERLDGRDPLKRNMSIFTYNEFMKEIMTLFKYRGDYELIYVFKEEIKQTFVSLKDFAIVPIPLSEERFNERGFNQAEAIASLAGEKILNLLKRTSSEKQSKKTKQERIFFNKSI
ncbi:ComF family protein [Piscibacillus salipiscarius]|uniref:ComF family protein n=1 Tax=Piscibacillus salipiscarius TaxID=299480 RepID=UPI000A3DDE29|nr:ComF family protein [Piscibacillus salipiscarius]